VAAYSVWRPLKRVTRDPIALLNWIERERDRAPAQAESGLLSGCNDNGNNDDDGDDGNGNGNRRRDITRDLHAFDYRAKGHKGDYLLEAYMISKPARAEDHEWYYVPDQEPHEVWMFKFADTESQYDDRIAACCGHGSPLVLGTEGADPRESVEARVLAFW
jgi:hypothetical protein